MKQVIATVSKRVTAVRGGKKHSDYTLGDKAFSLNFLHQAVNFKGQDKLNSNSRVANLLQRYGFYNAEGDFDVAMSEVESGDIKESIQALKSGIAEIMSVRKNLAIERKEWAADLKALDDMLSILDNAAKGARKIKVDDIKAMSKRLQEDKG